MAIFKYFTDEAHAQALIESGEMLFRPLSYFRAYEDAKVRGDPDEGQLSYAPAEGLVITKEDGTTLNGNGWRFNSSAQADAIFVWCASTTISLELHERFESRFCVEMDNPDILSARLRARTHARSKIDYSVVHCGPVEYIPPGRAPGADWALPERLAFLKPDTYGWQNEHRIAFGRRGAFDVQNVACAIEAGAAVGSAPAANSDRIALKVGSLAETARLHRL